MLKPKTFFLGGDLDTTMNTMAINLKGPLLYSCVGKILTDFSFKNCFSQLLLKYISIENLQTGNNSSVPLVLNKFLVKKRV